VEVAFNPKNIQSDWKYSKYQVASVANTAGNPENFVV
jgi:hypothetical protein